MRTLLEISYHCTTCVCVQPFEQPPCDDDHGPDCDEWVCTVCGAAILLDSPLYLAADVAMRRVA